MNEFFNRKGTRLELAGVRVTVVESNQAFIQASQAAVADGNAENIGSQVFQGRTPIAHRLAVKYPFLLPDLGGNLREESGLLQGLPELSAEDFQERLDWQLEIQPGMQPGSPEL